MRDRTLLLLRHVHEAEAVLLDRLDLGNVHGQVGVDVAETVVQVAVRHLLLEAGVVLSLHRVGLHPPGHARVHDDEAVVREADDVVEDVVFGVLVDRTPFHLHRIRVHHAARDQRDAVLLAVVRDDHAGLVQRHELRLDGAALHGVGGVAELHLDLAILVGHSGRNDGSVAQRQHDVVVHHEDVVHAMGSALSDKRERELRSTGLTRLTVLVAITASVSGSMTDTSISESY